MSKIAFKPFYHDGSRVMTGDRVSVAGGEIRIIGEIFPPEHILSTLIHAKHGSVEILPRTREYLPLNEDIVLASRAPQSPDANKKKEYSMSTTLERLEYGFDRDSRRTWRRRALATGEDNAYGYDGLSQVINAARGNLNLNATAIGGVPAEDEAWDYDPTGNWRGYRTAENGAPTLDQHRVHDRGNRLTQIAGSPQPVLVDRAGRMTQVPPDAGGDWSDPLELVWDAWSRLVEVRQSGSAVGSYAYDGLSRRTTRTTGGVTWHNYYSDAWRPLEERQDSQSTAALQYYWGARHRDDLVRRDRATTSGGSLNEKRYVLMDYFSPAAITDESGSVTERYAFSAFGVRRILAPDFNPRSGSECAWEFAFQGQFLDTESGFLDYGFRYYSPFLGRWTCKDPLQEAGGVNLYAFAKSDSVNAVDILGLVAVVDDAIELDIAAGVAVGALIGEEFIRTGVGSALVDWLSEFFREKSKPIPKPLPQPRPKQKLVHCIKISDLCLDGVRVCIFQCDDGTVNAQYGDDCDKNEYWTTIITI